MRKLLLSAALFALMTAPALAQTTAPADYRIGPRDVVDIKVYQDPTFNTAGAVGADGRIEIPLLGAVEISGLSTSEAARKIGVLLSSRYINNPDVRVTISQYLSRPVSIFGAVNNPGKFSLSGNTTLLDAIAQAGGLTTTAARTIYILRTASNGMTDQLVIDADELMVRGNPDVNIPLSPNDVINVMAEKQISIYLFGEVMKPGESKFAESQIPSLVQVLASAGGLTDRANEKNITIRRRENGQESTVEVDLRKILAGKRPDFVLKANDTVVVRESFF